jgi:hypothetical protein
MAEKKPNTAEKKPTLSIQAGKSTFHRSRQKNRRQLSRSRSRRKTRRQLSKIKAGKWEATF